jgi:hypothetical protein
MTALASFLACRPDLDHMNVPREINPAAAKALATAEKHTFMMQQYFR